jgi:hypothetical protein
MTDCVNRTVFIDGDICDEFFSGAYVWGDDADGYHEVRVEYESIDGYISVYGTWVLVHDTRPVAQFSMTGSFKENRKLELNDTSKASNDPYVIARYPITGYPWRFTGENECRRVRDISSVYKELLYKEPGFYGVELTVYNSLRSSEIYKLDFEILPDNPPAINLNIWNNVLARNEEMELTYEAVSVDGDSISAESFDIYYDENNDETYTRFLGTFSPEEFELFTASSLGRYKVIVYAREEFGQETILEL